VVQWFLLRFLLGYPVLTNVKSSLSSRTTVTMYLNSKKNKKINKLKKIIHKENNRDIEDKIIGKKEKGIGEASG
jgi:hypothetical protein